MEMKTFEAFTMRDALKAVKSHFGQDAVILNSREKTIEGSKGKLYEVTAARASAATAKGASRSYAAEPSGVKDHLFEMMDYFKSLERAMKQLNDEVVKRQDLFRVDAGIHELRTMVFEELVRGKGGALEKLPPTMAVLAQRLRLMGVDESEISRLMEYLQGLQGKGSTPEGLQEFYQGHAIRWMMKRLKIAPTWSPALGERSVHVVVGPSGSGKTSSVAKIAAHYRQEHKQRLFIVSFDNKRLAAREQLRIIAKVLDIPFEAIDEPEQLPALLDKNRDWDLCLVDTAAECPRVKEDLDMLHILKQRDLPVHFHLALSITEKESQMDRMIRGFSSLGIKSLIFNRLDESWSFGEMFNLCLRWSLPLSYFGVGRSVPEDLEKASRERVVERIFGL